MNNVELKRKILQTLWKGAFAKAHLAKAHLVYLSVRKYADFTLIIMA